MCAVNTGAEISQSPDFFTLQKAGSTEVQPKLKYPVICLFLLFFREHLFINGARHTCSEKFRISCRLLVEASGIHLWAYQTHISGDTVHC
jgi:hypothetical protein